MTRRTHRRWLWVATGLVVAGGLASSLGSSGGFGLDWTGTIDRASPPAGGSVVASPEPGGSTDRGGDGAVGRGSAGPGSSAGPSPSGPSDPAGRPGPSGAPSPSPGATVGRPNRPLLGPRTLDRKVLVRLVEDFRRRSASPGLSVAILWPDGTAWTIVSGLADLASGRPVTPATPFAVASVTKTFTAALVLRLVADGRLGLDDPVGSWLPELALPRGVTVRMLLDHTSGLGDPFLEGPVDRALLADRTAVWTADRFLAALPKPRFPPGKGWAYSNANYVVLGLLVERVTGRPYAALLRSTFFEPLGLSTAIVQPSPVGAVAPAHGYRLDRTTGGLRRTDLSAGSSAVPFTSVVTAAGAAGNVALAAVDLARWGAALYGGGILPPELVAEMVGDAVRTAPFEPRVPYGLGVQVIEIAGQPTYGHSGRFLGARAALRYLPQSGIAIAVLSNQSRSDIAPLVADLIRLVLPAPAGCQICQ